MKKKDLLIFFGQYRTFDAVIPQLKDLDKVDIIVSTWNPNLNGPLTESQLEAITKYIPHATILIEKELGIEFSGTSKMYYHWKKVINYLEDTDIYDKIIIHRTDILSNWHKILYKEIEDGVLYLDYREPFEINSFWIGDYFLIGKFKILKKFINLISKKDEIEPHFPLGNIILKNEIKFKLTSINAVIIPFFMKNILMEFNENNINLFDVDKYSEYRHKFVDIWNTHSPNHPITLDNFD